ncbi:MAG TPA: hypothetical protein VI076_00075 [Actinopolymorphaceae bacterium]
MGRGVTVMADRRNQDERRADEARGSRASEHRRYLVRATSYGFGVWDAVAGDWWIPRLDMSRRDAGEIVAELEARAARSRMEGAG